MDFLGRPPVSEDAVQYRLFLLQPGPLGEQEEKQVLLQHLENILAELAPLLMGYIWQHQPFNLHFHPGKGGVPAHLGGTTEYGDNVEDEWFIVYLLKSITQTFKDLAASVQDNDGEFLLIEAAEHLPKWLDPDSSENRVFLYHGELHILPKCVRPGEAGWPLDSVPSVQEALKVLHKHKGSCRAENGIQSALKHRLHGYPGKIQTNLHHAHCFVPAGVVSVLSQRPDLIAPAVSAFYLRDPVDLQSCRTFKHFPPESRVLTSVTFTRCLYAQLQQQTFVPDRRSGFTLPPLSHPQYQAYELGMKLAHGFEILCSKSGRAEIGTYAPVNSNPLWKGFLGSLKKNDYFKGELEGSALYRDLMAAAESYFQQSVARTKSSTAQGPGEEVLQILESTPLNLEDLKKQEAHLPSEDSDAWLNISPEQLESLLEERGCQFARMPPEVKSSSGKCEDEEVRQEEAGYTLVAVTQGMKKFINAMSSHEGAEFPGCLLSKPFTLDPDGVTSALDKLLSGKEELDSDDFEDEDDDDDDDDDDDENDEALEDEESREEQAGPETLENLKRYMDEMDQELRTTNVGQSFKSSGKQGGGIAEGDPCNMTQEDYQPLDVDVNLVTNLLESLSAQAGLAGPASNLLHSLGLSLPPNADPS